MNQQAGDGGLERLAPLVGEWSMVPDPELEDGRTISGAWEKCVDGRTWERDFGLTYTKLA